MSQSEPDPTVPADAPTRPLNDVLDVDIPADVASAFQTSLDADTAPRTLADWVGLLDDLVDDWPPAVDELCHTADGKHRADAGAQSFRFACVLDAMLLPFLHGEDTTITSQVPGGDELTVHVTKTDVTGPTDAVISFGAVGRPPEGDVTPAHAYGTICPYIHAFPDQAAYEEWADGVEGATIPLSLPDALGLSKAMAEV